MPRKAAIDELENLRSEIRDSAAAGATKAKPKAEAPPAAEPSGPADEARYRDLLHELQTAVDELAAEGEDVVSKHPLVSVASAFVLGIIVGRLFGRR